MNARDTAALVGILLTLAAAGLVAAWWRWIEAPARRRDEIGPPKHAATDRPVTNLQAEARAAEKEPAEWTKAALEALRGDDRPAVKISAPKDFAAWEADQLQWLQGARDAAKRWDVMLESGEWADAWWTRRR
jgi:hypothetical protein